MNPNEMTNQQLADAVDRLLKMEPVKRLIHAEVAEAARRLRNSVPRELYDKAWEECEVTRSKFKVSSDNGGPFFCVPIAPPTLLEIVDARHAHDTARTAHGEQ